MQDGEILGIIGASGSGKTTLLTNAMLLTEGYDEPSIDCVVCLRPTHSVVAILCPVRGG